MLGFVPQPNLRSLRFLTLTPSVLGDLRLAIFTNQIGLP
ncbi:hypothetical protein GXM_01230 [Nostoc sphaeroides CCNUC1]|uniref:Uncharacterized protein n=1 Tax=Nostoc sphaeroides CCNUC1 TaxID=2653204 RepID=A0A5P8VTQ2_9NOSO|nr:hypothetical protein GXM_01230 [Nostoc sphaeroides CCNUC1]